jgi:hypothetical protein
MTTFRLARPASTANLIKVHPATIKTRMYTVRVIHVRRLFGNKMRLIQTQVSVSMYCYHPGSSGPGSEKPWIDSTFA